MKMKTVEVTVGLFMVAGIVSLLMLALQVSGLGEFFHEEIGYKVKAEFANIGGLKPRAKVTIAGVTVGRVKNIILEPKTFNAEVIMVINPNRLPYKLPIDTRASIMTAGLLGDNYIALSPGFSETAFLTPGSTISIDNTDSAVALEQLISKFVANQVSPGMNESLPANSASSDTHNTTETNNTSDTHNKMEMSPGNIQVSPGKISPDKMDRVSPGSLTEPNLNPSGLIQAPLSSD